MSFTVKKMPTGITDGTNPSRQSRKFPEINTLAVQNSLRTQEPRPMPMVTIARRLPRRLTMPQTANSARSGTRRPSGDGHGRGPQTGRMSLQLVDASELPAVVLGAGNQSCVRVESISCDGDVGLTPARNAGGWEIESIRTGERSRANSVGRYKAPYRHSCPSRRCISPAGLRTQSAGNVRQGKRQQDCR